MRRTSRMGRAGGTVSAAVIGAPTLQMADGCAPVALRSPEAAGLTRWALHGHLGLRCKDGRWRPACLKTTVSETQGTSARQGPAQEQLWSPGAGTIFSQARNRPHKIASLSHAILAEGGAWGRPPPLLGKKRS